jgi:hypothetical protein
MLLFIAPALVLIALTLIVWACMAIAGYLENRTSFSDVYKAIQDAEALGVLRAKIHAEAMAASNNGKKEHTYREVKRHLEFINNLR